VAQKKIEKKNKKLIRKTEKYLSASSEIYQVPNTNEKGKFKGLIKKRQYSMKLIKSLTKC